MASSSKKTSASSSRSCKNRKGGRNSGKRARTEKKRKTHKWHQRGCQSGGGSLTGGWPWSPSDVHPVTGGASDNAGAGAGAGSGAGPVPHSINGNHYSLNAQPMAPPQNSNHLVEHGQYGGKKRKTGRRHRHRHSKSGHGSRARRLRRFVGEQHGGVAGLFPEVVNTGLRNLAGRPESIMNSLQGDSTAFRSSDPTIQPIAAPVQLR